jgi:hypothetical protein
VGDHLGVWGKQRGSSDRDSIGYLCFVWKHVPKAKLMLDQRYIVRLLNESWISSVSTFKWKPRACRGGLSTGYDCFARDRLVECRCVILLSQLTTR